MIRPEHDFSQDRDEWEQSVVDNAAMFTTARFLCKGKYDRREFSSLADAVEDARSGGRAMVYAVTESGRAVYVPEDKWPEPEEAV